MDLLVHFKPHKIKYQDVDLYHPVISSQSLHLQDQEILDSYFQVPILIHLSVVLLDSMAKAVWHCHARGSYCYLGKLLIF